jgi:hypothetical protein
MTQIETNSISAMALLSKKSHGLDVAYHTADMEYARSMTVG